MIRLLLLVVPLAALAGCKTENPAFCMANPDMCPDASNGARCSSDGDCKMAGFPACEMSKSTCEPCTTSNIGVCMGTTPRCESNACVACVDDVQDCKGGVCLATGDCADTSRIIHASSVSTKTSNCGDGTLPACSLNTALTLATPDGKSVIKLDDVGPFMAQTGFVVSNDVTIDARGATLTRIDDKGAVLTVTGGKTLTLLGGTIQGGHGAMGSGILCSGAMLNVNQTTITTNQQFGIDANPCTLTVTGARIENNSSTGIRAIGGSVTVVRTWLDTNSEGGIDVNGGQFTIVGNVVVNNGNTNGIVGGIKISTIASSNRLEFNSIAENKAQDTSTVGVGITCTANVGFVAKNNIVWSNNSAVANMAGIQILGCGHSYSVIGPAPLTGSSNVANNQNIDPKFKDKATDLHLTSASPLQMLQQSDPGMSLNDPKDPAVKDIDGDPRVAPVYIGADQYIPPKT